MASLRVWPVGRSAVGLDGERDHHRHVRLLGGAGDADRFRDVVHRDGGHHVGVGPAEGVHLRRMVEFRLLGGHRAAGHVAVAARPDAAADHHRRTRRLVDAPELLHHGDRFVVHADDRALAIAEPGAPVGARPPGRRLQHEAKAILRRERRVAPVIIAQQVAAGRLVEQVEGGKIGEVDAVVENQAGLDAAVGQKDFVSVHLRKSGAVFRHSCPCSSDGRKEESRMPFEGWDSLSVGRSVFAEPVYRVGDAPAVKAFTTGGMKGVGVGRWNGGSASRTRRIG